MGTLLGDLSVSDAVEVDGRESFVVDVVERGEVVVVTLRTADGDVSVLEGRPRDELR